MASWGWACYTAAACDRCRMQCCQQGTAQVMGSLQCTICGGGVQQQAAGPPAPGGREEEQQGWTMTAVEIKQPHYMYSIWAIEQRR